MPSIASAVTAASAPPGEPFQIARGLASDLLEGCYSDYLFFYNDHVSVSATTYYYQYYLVVGDIDLSENVFDCFDCTVYEIRVQHSAGVVRDSYTFSGSDTSGAFSGTLQSDWKQVLTYSQSFYSFSKSAVAVTVPSGCVCYSSASQFPHLVEGGDMYAFAALCAVAVAGVLVGMYRIFRHIL